MKTYTFKIKLQYPSETHPVVLSVIHCPLEVFYDSLKEFKDLETMYKVITDGGNKEKPSIYLTASDYLANDGVYYVCDDYVLCEYHTFFESKSLTDLLASPGFYGFFDNNSLGEPLQKEYYKKHNKMLKKSIKTLKKESKKDEV